MFKNKLSSSKEFLNTLSVGGFTQVFSMISALALNKFIALGPPEQQLLDNSEA